MAQIKVDLYDPTPDMGADMALPMPTFTNVKQPGSRRNPSAPTYSAPGERFRGFELPGTIPNWGNYQPQYQGTPQAQPFDFSAFDQAFRTAASGRAGTLADFDEIYPQLASQFPGLQRFGSKNDKIRLPNGQVIDAVLSAGLGGRGFNFTPERSGGYFSDPLLSQFAEFGQDAINRLLSPQAMNPVLQDAIGKLNAVFNRTDVPYDTFRPIADKRLAELEQPAWTDAQRALIQTNFKEPVIAGRDAAQQRALERASNRGIGLGSGVLEQEARGIDESYGRILGEGERNLAIQEIAANEARAQERVNIGQILAGLRSNTGPMMSAAGSLANIGSQLQAEPTERLLQALGISQNLAMLPGQQLAQAMAATNMLDSSPVPQADPMTGLISLLTALAGQGEGAYQNQLANESGFWQQLFGAVPGLIEAFTNRRPGTSDDTYYDG